MSRVPAPMAEGEESGGEESDDESAPVRSDDVPLTPSPLRHADDVLSDDDGDGGGGKTPEEVVHLFAVAMRACARSRTATDASCAIPALLGIVRADGAAAEATMLEAIAAVSSLVAGNAIHRQAAHDAGAVAVMLGLLQRDLEDKTPGGRALVAAATRTCYHLSGTSDDPECGNLMRLGGAIPLLLAGPLSRHETDPASAMWAAGALERIALSGPTSRHAIAHSRGEDPTASDGDASAESCTSAGASGVAAPALAASAAYRLLQVVEYAMPPMAGSEALLIRASEQHREAAVRAGAALAALMAGPESAGIVADATSALAYEVPRIGGAITCASKPLSSALKKVAKRKLRIAQAGNDESAMREALHLARTVRVASHGISLARHTFQRNQELFDDKRKFPWKHEGGGVPAVAAATYTPRAISPRAASPRAASPRPQPARGTGSTVGSASPRAHSPTRTSATGGNGTPRGGQTWTTAAAVNQPYNPQASSPKPAASFGSPPPLSLPSPLPAGHGVSLSYPEMERSSSWAPAYASPAVPQRDRVAAAEGAIDTHLGAARTVLTNTISSLCAEHDAATARLRSEARALQQALAKSRQREAELEGKLAKVSMLMTSLGLKHADDGRAPG